MKKNFLSTQNFIKELTIPEHIILWLNLLLSLTIFMVQLIWIKAYANWTTWITFAATVVSIFAVMAGTKKKLICPFLGIVASILLIAVSWSQFLYGSMIKYGYNIIMQTISLIIWSRNIDDTAHVKVSNAKWWFCIIYLVALIGLCVLWTWVESLQSFNNFWSGGKKTQPEPLPIRIFDSISLMFTIGAIVPMIKRYTQVWYMYIVANTSIAILWMLKGINTSVGPEQFNAWSMMCSGLCMTAISILGLVSWLKADKKKNKQDDKKNNH